MINITPEKIKILLVKIFKEGCSGRGVFYRDVLENPSLALKWAETSASMPHYAFELPELLKLLEKAFTEGQSSFQSFLEAIEYAVDELIAGIANHLKQPAKINLENKYIDDIRYFSSFPTYAAVSTYNAVWSASTSPTFTGNLIASEGMIASEGNSVQYYYNISENG